MRGRGVWGEGMISDNRKAAIKDEIGQLLRGSSRKNIEEFITLTGVGPVASSFLFEKYGAESLKQLDEDQEKDLVALLNKLLFVSNYANGNNKGEPS